MEEEVGCCSVFLQAIRMRIKSGTMMRLIDHQHTLFCAYIQQALLGVTGN